MPKQRIYPYIGTSEIQDTLITNSHRLHVQSSDDVIRWIMQTKQPREADGSVITTFIIDTACQLWINDRHSVHVHCAAGQSVLSAGEMTFAISNDTVEIVAITNQSTGYCPEPESWWAVDRALRVMDIPYPPNFTTSFIFRLCEACGTKNIVKDSWFECGVCQQPLSDTWNFDEAST